MKDMKKLKHVSFIGTAVACILVGSAVFFYPFIFGTPQTLNWNYRKLEKLKKASHGQPDFSFAVFGDNKNSIITFNKLIEEVNQEPVKFSIETGDLIDNLVDGNAEYDLYLKQIRKLNKPLLTIPGNHETEGISPAYYYLFGRNYYSFSYKNSYFIMLDGSHEKGLGPWQYEWLKKELEKSKSYKQIFAFMHIPLYDPELGAYQVGHSITDKSISEKINNLFDQYHVSMVFTAHVHGYFRGKWHETPYIITAGAGAELGAGDSDHYFHHFVVVHVKDDHVTYEVKRVGNTSDSILRIFFLNITEFSLTYFIAHWDLLLVIIGVIVLFLACYRRFRKHNCRAA